MPVGSIFGAERYKPAVKKKVEVPNKSVGASGSISLSGSKPVITIARSEAAKYVFSGRATARAAIQKAQGKGVAVPVIARTTSASPDNVNGLNRPYIQVLTLGTDAETSDAIFLKTKTNFYDNFILNSVNVLDTEKLDVVETFGNPHFFASGRFVKKAVISGVVRSQSRVPVISRSNGFTGEQVVNDRLTKIQDMVPDYVVFRNFYENYLRATLQASANAFTRVYVDGDYYDGFVQNLSFNQTAESEQTIPWSMSMLLIRSWNAYDQTASSILKEFMDDLKTERKVLSNREALLELQDTKGEGRITVNGGASKTDKVRTYINGDAGVITSDIYLELTEADSAALTVTPPTELAGAVALVKTDGTELTSIRAKEKVYVKLKVNNIARLTEYITAENTSVVERNVGKSANDVATVLKVSVSANGNDSKGCNIFFPVQISGGDSLQVLSATYTDMRTSLELKASINSSSDPAEVTFEIPQENISKFFTETGEATGKLSVKLAGKAGNSVQVADTTKVTVSNTSDVKAVTSSLAPSGEGVDGKCSAFSTSSIDASNLAPDGESKLSYMISSTNPAFTSSTNPFSSTEKLVYSLRGLYNVPGYEERAVEIKFIVSMPTPDALKGVVTGKPETRIVDGIVDIRIPIAKSAFVAGELPSATMAKLNSYTARLSITIDGNFDLQGTVLLAKGSSGVFRSSDQGGHISGKVSKAGILTNEAEQVYVWRAKIDVSSSAYLYANYRITQAKAVLTNDPFKSAK